MSPLTTPARYTTGFQVQGWSPWISCQALILSLPSGGAAGLDDEKGSSCPSQGWARKISANEQCLC